MNLTAEQLNQCIAAMVEIDDDSLERLFALAGGILYSRLPEGADGRRYDCVLPNGQLLTILMTKEDA